MVNIKRAVVPKATTKKTKPSSLDNDLPKSKDKPNNCNSLIGLSMNQLEIVEMFKTQLKRAEKGEIVSCHVSVIDKENKVFDYILTPDIFTRFAMIAKLEFNAEELKEVMRNSI